MPFAAALSTADKTGTAGDEVARAAVTVLGRDPALAVAFFSPHHAANAAELASVLAERTGAKAVIGVLGESVIGGSREIEDRPAVSLWVAAWDEPVSVDPFHLVLEETPDGSTLLGWPDALLEADP